LFEEMFSSSRIGPFPWTEATNDAHSRQNSEKITKEMKYYRATRIDEASRHPGMEVAMANAIVFH
jgi:hypothetical protein